MADMGKLKDIYERLKTAHCRYSRDKAYPTFEDGRPVELTPSEMLEVGRGLPREHLFVAYFGDSPTRIAYAGEDVNSMLKTIEELRLPSSWPSNLGEKIFFRFRTHLRKIESGPVHLEEQVVPGKEHQLEFVLRKLIRVYQKQDA